MRLEALKEAALSASKDEKRDRGRLALRRMGMMKPTPTMVGYFTVLPNMKAKSKGEVIWAMNGLSPMMLGPVLHSQPEIEPAENLENFHQFNKVFAAEVDEATGAPKQIWFQRRKKGYADKVPHRHKLGATKAQHLKLTGSPPGQPAAPLYSIYVAPDGKEIRFDYIGSRVFYCSYYERLARQTEEFRKLVDVVFVHKQNIVIAGYDARNADDCDIDDSAIARWYEDPSSPFGHEMVLHAMLYHFHTPDELPWRKAAEKLGFEL